MHSFAGGMLTFPETGLDFSPFCVGVSGIFFEARIAKSLLFSVFEVSAYHDKSIGFFLPVLCVY